MPSPHPGDFLLRGSFAAGFDLCDACTLRHISGPHSLMDAVQLANTYCQGAIWHQYVGDDGRPLGDPFLVTW